MEKGQVIRVLQALWQRYIATCVSTHFTESVPLYLASGLVTFNTSASMDDVTKKLISSGVAQSVIYKEKLLPPEAYKGQIGKHCFSSSRLSGSCCCRSQIRATSCLGFSGFISSNAIRWLQCIHVLNRCGTVLLTSKISLISSNLGLVADGIPEGNAFAILPRIRVGVDGK